MIKTLAIFASGKGSNVDNILHYFKGHPIIKIGIIVSSHKEAGVLQVAKKHKVPYLVLNKMEYYGSGEKLIQALNQYEIGGIVLSGFLWLIPSYLIEAYPHLILNIHPALLPHYGGKGMYGMHVHTAVWNNKEAVSGITIHEVNAKYDDGKIIFQATTPILSTDTPEDIAQKIHALEYKHFPKVIESYFTQV